MKRFKEARGREAMKTQLKQLAKNIFYMTPGDHDRPALGYICGKDCSVMVDSGNSPEHAKLFISELHKRNLKQPDYLILTHWHWDHIFGTSSINTKMISNSITATKIKYLKKLLWTDSEFEERINNGLEIKFCKDNMKAEMSTISSDMLKLPELLFKRTSSIGTNNECTIVHVGGDHSKDAAIIYSPEEKIAFIGDCIYMNIYTKIPHYTKSSLIGLLNKLFSINAEMYIDAHAENIISREDIKSFLDLTLETASRIKMNKNILNRADFPNKVNNKFCNSMLESWDFLLITNKH